MCQISQMMRKNPVMQKEATYSFLHDYLCPITTGNLYERNALDGHIPI